MVEMMMKKESSHWWWFDSHSTTKRSPWLQSTLSELDQKTQAMMKLIEEEADSFAKRAEMYYKKRPELVSMVEEFYRAHRSLAERYDQVKSDSANRLITTLGSPFSSTKHRLESNHKCASATLDRNYDTYSETSDHLVGDSGAESEVDDAESEVDDPDNEGGIYDEVIEKTEEVLNGGDDDEMRKLREEVERLREEIRVQKELILVKDEEKREAIRQLSFAVDMLKGENMQLRKCVNASSSSPSPSCAKKWNKFPFELTQFKAGILAKLFNNDNNNNNNVSPKYQTSVVAL